MKIYLILFLIPFASCGQSNIEFKFRESFSITKKKSICINPKKCFCFDSDSSLSYLAMYDLGIKCERRKLIDTVEFSSYRSKLHSFKSKNDNSYIILWETEYEYYPIVFAYYIFKGSLVKMGELNVSLPCKSCESFEFPINDIYINQSKDEIEISFQKEVNYRSDTEWESFKHRTLKYIFNVVNKEFKLKR